MEAGFCWEQNGSVRTTPTATVTSMGEVLQFPRASEPQADAPERLWRAAVGTELRRERTAREERLADVAGRAGVSTQYLSEVERGLKDPSSEILAAVAGALDLTVRELMLRVARSGFAGPVCLAA